MNFLVCEKQHGQGCDYTIGCGMKYYYVDADSIEDAQEKVLYPDGRDERSILEGESGRCEILIVPYDNVFEVDVENLKLGIQIKNELYKQAEVKRQEEAEFERLKKKLGK